MVELTPEFIERYVATEGREAISLARKLTPSQKLLMGPILYDREYKIVERLLRGAFPDADDKAITRLVRRVMGWYHAHR